MGGKGAIDFELQDTLPGIEEEATPEVIPITVQECLNTYRNLLTLNIDPQYENPREIDELIENQAFQELTQAQIECEYMLFAEAIKRRYVIDISLLLIVAYDSRRSFEDTIQTLFADYDDDYKDALLVVIHYLNLEPSTRPSDLIQILYYRFLKHLDFRPPRDSKGDYVINHDRAEKLFTTVDQETNFLIAATFNQVTRVLNRIKAGGGDISKLRVEKPNDFRFKTNKNGNYAIITPDFSIPMNDRDFKIVVINDGTLDFLSTNKLAVFRNRLLTLTSTLPWLFSEEATQKPINCEEIIKRLKKYASLGLSSGLLIYALNLGHITRTNQQSTQEFFHIFPPEYRRGERVRLGQAPITAIWETTSEVDMEKLLVQAFEILQRLAEFARLNPTLKISKGPRFFTPQVRKETLKS